MSFDLSDMLSVIEVMENYIEKIRPAENLRAKLDIGYKIEKQNVVLFEIRPHFRDAGLMIESPYAKATYSKTGNHWKIYWMRSNLKWTRYDPCPRVASLREFTAIVQEDEWHCFRG